METSADGAGKQEQARPGRSIAPTSTVGWWALVLSLIGLGSWVVLPMITMAFRDTVPITDTWVMPAIGTVLIVVAAVFDALCIWRWKERSVLNIVAVIITIPAALFALFMVVGEGIGGV